MAVKLLHPWIAEDADLRSRFAREARVLAPLEHEHVVRLYDYGARTARRRTSSWSSWRGAASQSSCGAGGSPGRRRRSSLIFGSGRATFTWEGTGGEVALDEAGSSDAVEPLSGAGTYRIHVRPEGSVSWSVRVEALS